MIWPIVPLESLAAPMKGAITDGPFGSNLARQHYRESGPRVLRLQNIGDGVFIDSPAHIDPEHFEALRRHEVLHGDLLVASLGEVLPRACLSPVGLGPAIVKADCIRVRLSDDVEPRWVNYSLQRPWVRKWAEQHRHGVGRPRLGLKGIRAIPTPLPPLAEQRRIVEVLEDHLSRLDAAGVGLGRAAQLEKALRSRAFGFAMNRLPADYVPLLDLASIANGQTPKGLIDRLVATRRPGDVPFYKVGDMNSVDDRAMAVSRTFISQEHAADLRLHIRAAGTVLLPKRGGAIATNKKRLLAEPAAYDLNTMGLWPGPRLLSEFMWHWLQTIDLGQLADGSNVPQINAAQIRGLRIPLLSIRKQQDVVRSCDAFLESGQRLARAIDEGARKGAALRRAVLAAAFDGRLNGRRTDDEVIEATAAGER